MSMIPSVGDVSIKAERDGHHKSESHSSTHRGRKYEVLSSKELSALKEKKEKLERKIKKTHSYDYQTLGRIWRKYYTVTDQLSGHKIAELKESIHKFKKNIELLETEREKLRKDMQIEQGYYIFLRDRHDEALKEMQKLKKQLSDLESQNKDLQQKSQRQSSIEAQRDKLETDLRQQLSVTRNKIGELEAELERVKDKREKLIKNLEDREEHFRLETKKREYYIGQFELQTTEQWRAQITRETLLQQENAKLQSKVSALEPEAASRQKKHEGQVSLLKSQLGESDAEMAKLRARTSAVESELAQKKARVESQEIDIQKLEAEKKVLLQSVAEQKKAIGDAHAVASELAQKKARVDLQEEVIQALEADKKELLHTVAEQKKTIADKEMTNGELKRHLAERINDAIALATLPERQKLNDENDKLKRLNESLIDQLEAMKSAKKQRTIRDKT